ncbi:hypothetical protein [Nakamurella sp.]|uniref:hypothetical protein n=1 Tax=Nakamurella sp. TaxID=1869182 RepID=UPI00378338F7
MNDSSVQSAVTPPGPSEPLTAAAAPGGHRIQGWIVIGSAALAVTGNVLHPRSTGDGVETYRMIADSIAWPVATLLIGIALTGLVIGVVPICRSARRGATAGRAAVLDAAGWALAVGGTIGIAQQGVDGIGLPRQAAAFVAVDPEWNAFPYWSVDAVAAINSSLAVIWYVLVLGVVPVLLAVAYRGPYAPGRVIRSAAAAAGTLTAATVAVITVGGGNGVTDSLFLAGSLVVTGWFVVLGVAEVRDPRG